MQNDFNQDPFEEEQNTNTEMNPETNTDPVDTEPVDTEPVDTEPVDTEPESGRNTDSDLHAEAEPEQKETQGSYYSGEESYTYRKPEEPEIPRWKPYEETYRTVSKPEKPKKRWVIPLVVVLGIMVLAIVVGVIFGAKRLSSMVNNSSPQQPEESVIAPQPETGDAEIAIADTGDVKEAESGEIILTDVSDVVAEVIPSVVSITSRTLVDSGGYGDYWDFFFGGSFGGSGRSGGEKEEVESGIGSGTIISQNSKELLILTSYHVVEGSSSLYVTFHDGSSVDGTIKSQSEDTDIAIVAVPLADISKETMNDIRIAKMSAEPAKVGEGAIVIGNPLGYGISVTSGIVSAVDREINIEGRNLTVLQTDAAINSGNSGGCVINKRGEIIGISEAKIVISSVEGMCYAIQVSSNTDLIQTLLNDDSNAAGKNAEQDNSAQGAYLGIRGRDVDRSLASSYGMPQGIYVASTVAGSGAEAAGIQEGDIIVGMDNVSFTTMEELQEQLSRHNPGDKVDIILMREESGNYKQVKVQVTLSDIIS